MTKRERIQACIQGNEVDRPPISFWRHFPKADRHPEQLAQATLQFQQQYDLDFIKLMPNGLYAVLDWGLKVRRYRDPKKGEGISRYVVHEPEDWERLAPLDPTKGVLGQQLECLEILNEQLKGGVPLVQTIFSPLTSAAKLAGCDRIKDHLVNAPQKLQTGLEIITQSTIDFARSCVKRGIDGVFFATQWASYKLLSEKTYRKFGKQYDIHILDAVQADTSFNILHLHGDEIMFDLLLDYPVQAVNWHDRLTRPTLGEAITKYGGCVIGGLDHEQTMRSGTKAQITQQVQDAIQQTRGKRLIVGPGCVLDTDVPAWRLQAARKAIDRAKPGLFNPNI